MLFTFTFTFTFHPLHVPNERGLKKRE